MVLLNYTELLVDRLDTLNLPDELKSLLTFKLEDNSACASDSIGATKTRTIPHEALVKISRWSRSESCKTCRSYVTVEPTPGGLLNSRNVLLASTAPCSLASLLSLTDVYAPPLLPREKSPELLAILAKIQLEQERESYNAMTSNGPIPQYRSLLPMKDRFDASTRESGSEAEDWQLVKKQVSAIVNVGASMTAVGTGVWWVGGGRTYAARLVLALTAAVLIGVIEAFLYYRFFTREAAKPDTGRTKTKALRFEKPVSTPIIKPE